MPFCASLTQTPYERGVALRFSKVCRLLSDWIGNFKMNSSFTKLLIEIIKPQDMSWKLRLPLHEEILRTNLVYKITLLVSSMVFHYYFVIGRNCSETLKEICNNWFILIDWNLFLSKLYTEFIFLLHEMIYCITLIVFAARRVVANGKYFQFRVFLWKN